MITATRKSASPGGRGLAEIYLLEGGKSWRMESMMVRG